MSRQLYTILFTLGIVLSSHGMQLPEPENMGQLPGDVKNTTSNFFDGPSALKTEAEGLFRPIDILLLKQTDYSLFPQRDGEIKINALINHKLSRVTDVDTDGNYISATMVVTPSLSVFNSNLYPVVVRVEIPSNQDYFNLMVKSDNQNLNTLVGALAESVAQQERLITQNNALGSQISSSNIDLLKKIRLYDLYLLTGILRHRGKSFGLTDQGIQELQNILKPTDLAWKYHYGNYSGNSGYTELMLALKYRKDNKIDQKNPKIFNVNFTING